MPNVPKSDDNRRRTVFSIKSLIQGLRANERESELLVRNWLCRVAVNANTRDIQTLLQGWLYQLQREIDFDALPASDGPNIKESDRCQSEILESKVDRRGRTAAPPCNSTPQAAKPKRQKTKRRQVLTTCPCCGNSFTKKRPSHKYCSKKCARKTTRFNRLRRNQEQPNE